MTCDICSIVGECAQRKSIIIQIVRFPRVAEERKNKITAFHIVGEIAEKDAAMRVIAQVLNNRAAVGVPARASCRDSTRESSIPFRRSRRHARSLSEPNSWQTAEGRTSGNDLLHQNSILNEWFERGGYLRLKLFLSSGDGFRRRIGPRERTPD